MVVEPLRVSVAADGTLAAIHESPRITVVEVPSGAAFAEIGVDPDALGSEVAWVCTPPRLLVLARHAAHSTIHLLDPHGPRSLAEIRLPAPMRLFATVGGSALVVGAQSAAVLAASDSYLMPYQFPARIMPVAAGAAAGQFVVALPGSIEEWDPQSRMPKRRLRLPRAAAITAVGGSERVVWMTTQQEPARIDVIPLANRGQPKSHDLPEPIARIAGHPRSDLVACVGADTGRIYVVDLDGRAQLRSIEPGGLDRTDAAALVVGRMLGVLAARAQRPIAIVPLDGRDAGIASDPGIRPIPLDEPDEPARPSTLGGEPGRSEPSGAWMTLRLDPPLPAPQPAQPPAPSSPPPSAPPRSTLSSSSPQIPVPPEASPSPSGRPAPSTAKRFSAWRDLMRQHRERADPLAPASSPAASPPPSPEASPPRSTPRSPALASWRDEVAAWSQTASAGTADRDAPAAPAIDALIARFELAVQLRPALVMLYGAHLCGERGVAPLEIARVLDHSWDEALGRGELARRCIAEYFGSRVALSPLILRVLDELPPLTGTLVGEPGPIALLGSFVLVAPDEPLPAVAAQHLPHVGGAILAAHDGVDRTELLLEARAHGATPMLRIAASPEAVPGDPAIFVVGDADLAERVGLPRLV